MTAAEDVIVAAVEPWIGSSLEHGGDQLKAYIGANLHDPRQLLDPHISSCGLFALAVWSEVGIEHHLLAGPYEVGSAIKWLVEIAHDLGAIRYPRRDGPPVVGALMHYYSPRPSHNDHVEFCLSKPDALHHARHAGGGRPACGIDDGESDILWSSGRALQCWYDPNALLP
jgi:hypothetical protein